MRLISLIALGCLGNVNAYCTDGVGPRVLTDSSLGKVTLANLKHTPNDCNGPGAQDFTAESASLEPGEPYVLQADVTTCGTQVYTRQIGAYIDFSGDGKWDDSELLGVVDCDGAATIPVDIPFTVPNDAKNGNGNRMRVIVMETQFGAPDMDPCVTYDYGGMKDFTINIPGGLSGGSIFLIILFVGLILYCLFGCVLNVKKNGKAVGLDAVPQREFWFVALPLLVKEGCIFTKGKCMGLKTNSNATSGATAYDNL